MEYSVVVNGVEVVRVSGEPIARFDENGISECGAVRGM